MFMLHSKIHFTYCSKLPPCVVVRRGFKGPIAPSKSVVHTHELPCRVSTFERAVSRRVCRSIEAYADSRVPVRTSTVSLVTSTRVVAVGELLLCTDRVRRS